MEHDLIESLVKFPPSFFAAGFAFVNFLLGFLIGHRLALLRDKRREYNKALEPIRAYLLKSIDYPGWQTYPSLVELDAFIQALPWWMRNGFRKAWNAQNEEAKKALKRGPAGEVSYSPTDGMIAAYRRTLKYAKPR